ncbi:MAG: protein PhnA [Myxococcota bacterium]|jgi:protein PhnA
MARGRDEFQAHKAGVAALGRSLSRRAGSRCELCGEGEGLRPIEVAGGPAEPDPEWALLACERCRDAIGPKPKWEAAELRFLETAVWSDVVPAQLAAVRLTRSLAASGVGWATDLLDGLYLDPVVEGLL